MAGGFGGIINNPQLQQAMQLGQIQQQQPGQAVGQFPQQPGQLQPQQPEFMTPLRDQNPQVAEMIRQGNMQGAMDLQMQLAAQNGKFFEPRPPGFVGNPVYPGQVQIQPYPMPQVQPRPTVIQPGPNVFPRPQGPQQRGLGGLQMNKFRNRLGQR